MRWRLASFRLLPPSTGAGRNGGQQLSWHMWQDAMPNGPALPGKKQTLVLLLAASLYYSSLSLIRHNIGVKIEQKKKSVRSKYVMIFPGFWGNCNAFDVVDKLGLTFKTTNN